MGNELKVNFYLRHKEMKKDETVPIMGRITIGKQMAQFSAKLSVAISCYSQNMRRVNDSDFASFSDGQIVPHGIYDVNTNTGL